MSPATARLSAIASVALALAAAVVLYATSHPGSAATEVRAEFEDAYPLLQGMHVREYGAVAGRVADVEVTKRGTALVTMRLHEGADPPRVDATAAIRQEDVVGDSYVALSPGEGTAPLGERIIPLSRTISAPRFDDLLNSFDEPVRQSLELALVELGKTLEGRGEDLNEAALTLRPALSAANAALLELRGQNASLRALVADAQRVTTQAAERSRELGGLVAGLSKVVETTAAHAPALDAGLERLPPTLAAARRTLGRLERFATATRPLASSLHALAPELTTAARRLGPFAGDAEAVLDDIDPTVALTTELLVAAEPTLEANPKRFFTAPFEIASGFGELLDTLLGDPSLVRALFGADTYGGTRRGDFADDVGLGAIAVELGSQDGYPTDYDPLRRFVRASAVPTCESWGLPIRPGCLLEAASVSRRGAAPADRRRGGRRAPDSGRGAEARTSEPPKPDPGGRGADPLGELGERLGLGDRGRGLGPAATPSIDRLGGAAPLGPRDRRPRLDGVEAVFDFLLRR